jgi:Txe/YoeB family toxin of Txe-Axe toxin-antitoxin module
MIRPEHRVYYKIDDSDVLLLVFNFIAFYKRLETEVKKFVRFINSLDTNASCEIVNQLMVEHLQEFRSIIQYADYILYSFTRFEGRNKYLHIDFRSINKIKEMLSDIKRLGKDID